MLSPYIRIIAETGESELPLDAIVKVDSFDMAYLPGHGLDRQPIGVFVVLEKGRLVRLDWRQYANATPEEAKAYRAEQKRLRSRTRRGLPA